MNEARIEQSHHMSDGRIKTPCFKDFVLFSVPTAAYSCVLFHGADGSFPFLSLCSNMFNKRVSVFGFRLYLIKVPLLGVFGCLLSFKFSYLLFVWHFAIISNFATHNKEYFTVFISEFPCVLY